MTGKPFFDAREQAVLANDPADQARRMAAIESLGLMVKRYGIGIVTAWVQAVPPDPRIAVYVETFGTERVGKWVRYFRDEERKSSASRMTLSMERPTDRCLADGAALTVNKICVQCGRDNS